MKIVKESILNEGKVKLALAAGLVIIQDNKILLVHPTNAPWWKSYSIPKGHVNPGEELIDTAKRETAEETGLDVKNLIIKSKRPKLFVDYIKGNKVHKRVYYFVATPKKPISKKDFKLQKNEVDWAGFLNRKDALLRISPRFKKILKLLK